MNPIIEQREETVTYPAQPGYPPQAPQQPQYPAQPAAPAYPPQQGFAPQQPAQPQYPAPQQYAPAQPGYPPQGFAPQQYAPQQPEQQGPPPAAGSLDAYWAQPSTGWGPAWSITAQTPVGARFAGIVARPITDSDIEQQTEYQKTTPAFYRDGRPKFVMKVPLFVAPDQTYPDGRAQFYVSGSTRDELVRAMGEAGAPAGPPEEGATIHLEVTGKRQNRSGTLSTVSRITYQRPQGGGQAQPPAAPAAPQVGPVEQVAPAPQQPAAPLAPPAAPQQPYTPPAAPQAPAQPAAAAPPAAPAAPQPPAPTAIPPEIAGDPAKAQLLAQLLGQGAG